MSSFEVSPAMCLALDAYRVPPLPEDFAERLVARALAEIRQRPAAPLRTSRWHRTGRIVTGVALAGLLTATAAAAGWLGKPIYVPVISELIERLAPTKLEGVAPATVSQVTAAPRLGSAPLIETATPSPVASPPAAIPSPVIQNGEPEVPAPVEVAVTPEQPPIITPSPAERAELRREPAQLAPQRAPAPAQTIAAEPSPAPTRTVIDTAAPIEPVTRATLAPTRTIAPVPREIRPAERLRTPVEPRPVRTAPSPTERRQQLRERRIP
jgi:hypothetical protein